MTGVYVKKCFDEVVDTSEGALSAHLQRIAREELGETPEKRREALEELKRQLDAEPDLNARKDDEFLLRFLRVRKYDVDLALRNVRNYYRNRDSSGSVYVDFLPSNVPPAARTLYMRMPEKDVLGRPIFVFRPGMWMPEEVPYMDFHRAGLICYEHLACDPVVQTVGIVLLVDFSGFTADKLLSMSISLLRRALEYIQDCMPIRLKAVHVVKQSYAFDMLFALVRPFTKSKLAQRDVLRPPLWTRVALVNTLKARFHGENFERLHEEIPPEVLPEEYGGHGPALDFDAFWKEVEASEENFEANNRFGYGASGADALPEDCEQPQECTPL